MAGTKKNYRLLELQTPDALRGSMPQLNKQLYLYKIDIQPNFGIDDVQDNVIVFHNLLKSNRSYGILTTKPIPRLAKIKLYQSFGELNAIIDHNPIKLILKNAQQLDELKRFNCTLFRDVLEVWKEFFVYDSSDSFITVPMIDQQIDWDIVKAFQTWLPVQEKTITERSNTKFIEQNWLHKVICPWYRADNAVRYVVTRVCTNETPFSPFPNDQYESYAEYAREKYPNITRVVVKDQFLIEVKGITQNPNLMHPGDGDDGRRMKTNRGPEVLIPELCHNFNYPGDLWLKAICLPSIIYRLTYLLHAETIRVSINKYIGLNITNYDPPALLGKLPRNKIESAKIIQNAIIRPRPDDKIAKELRINDVCRFNKINEVLGPEIEEPIDVERNFDQLHELDIDYYYRYINEKFRGVSLNDTSLKGNVLSPNRFQMAEIRGICDTLQDDKLYIQLLDTKLSTSIRGVEQHNLLAAITTTSANDLFHMELFEVLGDAFLKFGVSLFLMHTHNDWHEGFLTAIKGQIVGNRNLCYNAVKMKLSGMINKNHFNPKDDWQPPMLKVDEVVKVSFIIENKTILFSIENDLN